MALIVADNVLETTTTTGTGALALLGAISGSQAFDDVCANSDTCYYSLYAVDVNGNRTGAWEAGLGTFTDTDTLTRTSVHASSNAGAAVNLAAGTKHVQLDATATYLVALTRDAEATTAEYRANTADRSLTTDKVWASADYVALNDAGGNIAVDMATGFNFSMTMDGDYTLSNPTNTKNGQTGCIVLTQDGTGTQTLAYDTNWEFASGSAPVLSTAANAKDILFYQVISSTSIFANLVKAVA